MPVVPLLPFMILAAVAILMAAVSLFPSCAWLYSSPWAVALWALVVATAVPLIVRRRLWRRPAVFALHVAFVVILAGALCTRLLGVSERVSLAVGESARIGDTEVTLLDFETEYYPGTTAPADFVASVAGAGSTMRISMNKVGSVGPYRLFLASRSPQGDACTFIATADGIGTTVTYIGYGLLLLSMLAISMPRRLVPALILAACAAGASAAAPAHGVAPAPTVLPAEVADGFGRLYVYHADRVAPFSTLARDFTLKVYGTTSYRGLTPEQVLTGWLFYPSSWQSGPELPPLCQSAASGSLFLLYPYAGEGQVRWYSPVSELPPDMDLDHWRLTRFSIGYLAELASEADWQGFDRTLSKIARYQAMVCGPGLPSPARCRAERIFLHLSPQAWPVVLLAVAALALLMASSRRRIRGAAIAVALAGAVWVGGLIALNWYASAHVPMANGYETMQWMALCALLAGIALARRHPPMAAVGVLVAALALAVALMGQRNPQIANLAPVLRSPLLSIHVLTVMVAYALLAIIAVASALWLCGRRSLLAVGRRLLRPAVFFLAAGIFVGAVWANVSWGRYWGWDPKEVWALITMLVYSFPLHGASLPAFRRDRFFAIYTLCALAALLTTYLAAPLLGGLHSYR